MNKTLLASKKERLTIECLTLVSIPVCCGLTRIFTAKSTALEEVNPVVYHMVQKPTDRLTGTRMLSRRTADGLMLGQVSNGDYLDLRKERRLRKTKY